MAAEFEQERIDPRQNYFSTLPLGFIYGDRITSALGISRRSYQRLTNPDQEVALAEAMKIINQGFIRTITTVEASRGRYTVYEGMPEGFTWWAPHQAERNLFTRLAYSLSDSTPVVVDAASGSGFLAKLIAVQSDVRVLGIDLREESFDHLTDPRRLPDTPGDVRLVRRDIWNAALDLGPTYPRVLRKEREQLMRLLKRPARDLHPYRNRAGKIVERPDVTPLSEELRRLQRIAPQYTNPSIVDVATCSFMPDGFDLTVPIRDGIYPKAIVYIRQVVGNSGSGDYFLEEQNVDKLRYAQVSYNPGEHYEVVARWRTQNRQDWHRRNDPKDEKFEFQALNSEVIVQVRKDIVPNPKPAVVGQVYQYDEEIEKLLDQQGEKEIFFDGIRKANEFLFGK